MAAYYNEIDPFAAAWLRELITAGHIAPGDVDTRSIVDVRPSDLLGYTQCHFFAGIGVWSYALRRAGWADDRPVWTGSCPCQPFSAAGKGGGFDDERHLWPAFYHLIGECGPAVVFGEQVASKDADPWIDLVQADMEALGYAFGAVPFPSAGIGAPHIRDRTYWLADANRRQRNGQSVVRRLERDREDAGRAQGGRELEPSGHVGRLDDDDDARLEGQRGRHHAEIGQRQGSARSVAAAGELGGLVDPNGSGTGVEPGDHREAGEEAAGGTGPDDGSALRDGASSTGGLGNAAVATRERNAGGISRAEAAIDGERFGLAGRLPFGPEHASAGLDQHGAAGPTNGLWRDADWLFCRDGKWRPVEPGTFPLVARLADSLGSSGDPGAPIPAATAEARVGRLRGYGNAINAIAAETFITAYLEKDVVEIDAERLRLTGAFA